LEIFITGLRTGTFDNAADVVAGDILMAAIDAAVGNARGVAVAGENCFWLDT
jgi:hypothetical protein